ncbi:hypothetical protein [Streptomyces sp. NPDC059398]|uniref:hypothetical protein n=1 Tax=Streptomyces sp. NPDC059398 TaxID=3346820 RepID=UPI00367E72A7
MGASWTRWAGAATVAYGVGTMVRPVWLARPCQLTGRGGSVPAPTALLVRAMGARDAAIGTAMMVAKNTSARRTATVCRVVADLSDAVLFGTQLPDPAARRKAAAAAGAWAALCTAAAAADGLL